MADYYTYQKKRKDYGRPCNFKDTDIRHCGYFIQRETSDEKDRKEIEGKYDDKNPNFITLDNIAELSENSVNTERVKTGEKGMYHKEGGWPSNVDPSEQSETAKYKKRIDKDPKFGEATKELYNTIEYCVKQNNQIDMFEEYFQNEKSEHIVENLSTKTILLFKDHSEVCKRAVSDISWHPESSEKLVASYAIMRFQSMPAKMETQAYIWSQNDPNKYYQSLNAPSPVTSISYSNKSLDVIGSGCYNGLAAFWDVRKSGDPIYVSPVQQSHSDPITKFSWINNKLGTECVTVSTDGCLKWWDYRKMDNGPIETLNITDAGNKGEDEPSLIGGTCLEFNQEAAPNKYLIGTEQGLVIQALKKLKAKVEITTRYGLEMGKHMGPIYSIHRSTLLPKFFLSVGDWSAKIWCDDLKQPLIRTRYHGAYLADGTFSPTRPGCFFLARRDGWLDVWDYYYRQNEVAFSHKVSDSPLTCIKLNTHPAQQGGAHHGNQGKYAAIGDQDGTVTILELCESLYTMQTNEKDIMSEMFDREVRKEKNLEAIKKQQLLQKKQAPKDNTKEQEKRDKRTQELIAEATAIFEKQLAEAEKLQNEEQEQDLVDLDSPRRGSQQDNASQQNNNNNQEGGEEGQQQEEAQQNNNNGQQEDQQQFQQQQNQDGEQQQQQNGHNHDHQDQQQQQVNEPETQLVGNNQQQQQQQQEEQQDQQQQQQQNDDNNNNQEQENHHHHHDDHQD